MQAPVIRGLVGRVAITEGFRQRTLAQRYDLELLGEKLAGWRIVQGERRRGSDGIPVPWITGGSLARQAARMLPAASGFVPMKAQLPELSTDRGLGRHIEFQPDPASDNVGLREFVRKLGLQFRQ